MSENACDNNCESCSQNCENRIMKEKQNAYSNIKKVIGVVSGKGGVGKSLVTSLLAVNMRRKEYQTAILDADITGPSIPKGFGLNKRADSCEQGIFPVTTSTGIKVMSINLLLEKVTDPVLWRGPLVSGTVKQFWTDVLWDDVDFMFVDMPPGTGDVALTVFQSLPIDGLIIVTSPQELVSMIVGKAVNMAKMMNVPVLGIVENMSYFKCPDCGKEHKIYGESNIDSLAKEYGISNIAKLPITPKLAAGCDKGFLELYDGTWLDDLSDKIENLK